MSRGKYNRGILMNINDFISLLDHFDDLFQGDPRNIEANLSALLPYAQRRSDQSVYLQILSQIALAQAMQQRFDEAHRTLDLAESSLQPQYVLARIRILLERGRVFHQSHLVKKALPFFIQSYELSKSNPEFDVHTLNAAHMIAIVQEKAEDKIKWNEIALRLAESENDKKCRAWLGPLHNNLAQNYLEAERYLDALHSFQTCKDYAEEKGDSIIVRGASWGKARALRSLERFEKAFEIQHKLLKEYGQILEEGSLPIELIRMGRGLVYEELTELYFAENRMDLAEKYAELAYDDFIQDRWIKEIYPKRIDRMHYIATLLKTNKDLTL